jgi:hypothetical protein
MSRSTEYRLDITNIGIEEAITSAIEDDEELIQALIGDLDMHDSRAEYTDESFSVDEVSLRDNGEVHISYSYEWNAYYGCKDMCKAESNFGSAIGHIVGGELVFQVAEREKRTTFEEF